MKSKEIIVISKFAIEGSGHSLLDDKYYFSFLKKSGVNFKFYTSQHSINQILDEDAEGSERLFATDINKIKISYNAKVIFLGFLEKEVFLFALKNIFKFPKLVLVATNNFSNKRVSKYKFALKSLFLFINVFLYRLVIHTKYEQGLVKKVNARMVRKTYIKKHHLMTPINNTINNKNVDTLKPVISYFGPIKHDKPIEPIINLIQADRSNTFIYKLYRVDIGLLKTLLPNICDRKNVVILPSYQDSETYLKAVVNSHLIFLSHTKSFEGKLSGNLCDCISLNVPYISNQMEPMLTYHEKYGALGYLVDYSCPNWAINFLDEYCTRSIKQMNTNLANIAEDHLPHNIEADLVKCFIE